MTDVDHGVRLAVLETRVSNVEELAADIRDELRWIRNLLATAVLGGIMTTIGGLVLLAFKG